MMQTMLHVIFTPSGAGSLNQALRSAGRDDQVVSFFDDLSFGPINPADSSLRAKWVENELAGANGTTLPLNGSGATRFPPTIERSCGCRGDLRWNMQAFWNGSGGWAVHLAKWST
jgi:hypothetical protein